MSKRFKFLAIGLTVVGIMALALSSFAFADDPVNDEVLPPCEYAGLGHQHGLGAAAPAAEVVSELTGLTPEEIHAQRHEGKSLVEIAAAQGVSEDALVEAILAARQEVIQQKVADGILTQEQADLMFQQMEQSITQAVNRTTVGPPEGRPRHGYAMGHGYGSGAMGHGYGRGGMHGGWGIQ